MFVMLKLLPTLSLVALTQPILLAEPGAPSGQPTTIVSSAATTCASEPVVLSYPAHDTLDIRPDPCEDAQRMLDELKWPVAKFTVTCRLQSGWPGQPAVVSFPSPRPQGNAAADEVVMEWYPVQASGEVISPAPAMLILHISDGRLVLERVIARLFAAEGIHAFVMQMPGYGSRRPGGHADNSEFLVSRMFQAAADARRARDAVAAIPQVRPERIGIEGTSLGGFVAVLAAGLDGAFAPVCVALAGANLHEMLLNGQRDSARAYQRLLRAGYDDRQIGLLLYRVEPRRLAHRLDPHRTYLYSATQDEVVPPANARALAQAARLEPGHHVWFNATHYSGVIYLPWITSHMAAQINDTLAPPSTTAAPPPPAP